jgi:hypothetical protein
MGEGRQKPKPIPVLNGVNRNPNNSGSNGNVGSAACTSHYGVHGRSEDTIASIRHERLLNRPPDWRPMRVAGRNLYGPEFASTGLGSVNKRVRTRNFNERRIMVSEPRKCLHRFPLAPRTRLHRLLPHET